MPNTPNRNLLPDSSVCRALDISQRTLQRHLREGKIDAPIGKLGKNRRGWTRPEIELIREQLAHRESAKAQPA
jgi:predicted site-specific integrase-resolvase